MPQASPKIAKRNEEIIRLARAGLSRRALASRFGLSKVTIDKIIYTAKDSAGVFYVAGRITKPAFEKLSNEAVVRGLNRADIVAKLLEAVAADNLFNALLEE